MVFGRIHIVMTCLFIIYYLDQSIRSNKKAKRYLGDLKEVVLEEINLAFGNHPSFKLKAQFDRLEKKVNRACNVNVGWVMEDGRKKLTFETEEDYEDYEEEEDGSSDEEEEEEPEAGTPEAEAKAIADAAIAAAEALEDQEVSEWSPVCPTGTAEKNYSSRNIVCVCISPA